MFSMACRAQEQAGSQADAQKSGPSLQDGARKTTPIKGKRGSYRPDDQLLSFMKNL
jgi:hypothetical protein